jgi:hypothetical protein
MPEIKLTLITLHDGSKTLKLGGLRQLVEYTQQMTIVWVPPNLHRFLEKDRTCIWLSAKSSNAQYQRAVYNTLVIAIVSFLFFL